MASVARENLGAWLLRCNPRIWGFPEFVEAGNTHFDGWWSVVNNYRTRLMTPGNPVILWVSGQDKSYPRGIWGTGHVTSEARVEAELVGDDGENHDSQRRPAAPTSADDPQLWVSQERRLAVTMKVDVHLALLLEAPLTDVELRRSGITDLEVQRQSQGSNPSWVTKQQLSSLAELLGGLPGGQSESSRGPRST